MKLAVISMDAEFDRAHQRATMYAKLGRPNLIFDDDEIPHHLQQRVYNYVTGEGAPPLLSLPESATSGDWFEDLDEGSNFRNYLSLLEVRQWPEQAIQSIETTTRQIMNFLFDPSSDAPHKSGRERHGLVVGRVQSGKTANYAGLIARAADAGYTMVVVLAGLHNNLRKQTQVRLQKELVDPAREKTVQRRLVPKTNDEQDFQSVPDSTDLVAGRDRCNLFVIKKNVSPLSKLVGQLSSLSELDRMNHRLLVIDDEADHATINTKKSEHANPDLIGFEDVEDDEEDEAEITDATKINSLMRQLLGIFSHRAYVGYTATPFANVLINPTTVHDSLGKSLYPRDFIIALPKPQGYFGLEEFFPDVESETENLSSQIHMISHDEAMELRSLDEEYEDVRTADIPAGLRLAMMDYYLSGAMRLMRDQAPFHHSMLVHAKHTKSNQAPIFDRVQNVVEIWRTEIPSAYSADAIELRKQFQARWNATFLPLLKEKSEWVEVEKALIQFTLKGVLPRLINSDSGDDLEYEKHTNGLFVIAVGGNRLSRGLTLEGLCTTYFVRETKMYDTLTQMGRWFGYRHGYHDLVRLHLTSLLLEWFTWLSGVEKALLADIERYSAEKRSPKELGIRIRKHSAMLPTARNKMRHAKLLTIGHSSSIPRTLKFQFEEPDILNHNLASAASFVQNLNPEIAEQNPKNGTLLWRGVDPGYVLSLLQGYTPHSEDKKFNVEGIQKYIEEGLNVGELTRWSVALVGTNQGKYMAPFSKFGLDLNFPLPMRTRLRGTESVGEVYQATHMVLDLPGPTRRYREDGQTGPISFARMFKERRPENPLLLMYIIDPESAPEHELGSRTCLFRDGLEKIPPVGLVIVFPSSPNFENRDVAEYWALEDLQHD